MLLALMTKSIAKVPEGPSTVHPRHAVTSWGVSLYGSVAGELAAQAVRRTIYAGSCMVSTLRAAYKR